MKKGSRGKNSKKLDKNTTFVTIVKCTYAEVSSPVLNQILIIIMTTRSRFIACYGFDSVCLLWPILYYLIKAYRAGYQALRILFFVNLISSSVSGAKGEKTCLHFAIFNCKEKSEIIFKIALKGCGLIVQKMLSEKKKFRNKVFRGQVFFCLYIKLTTVQIWGQENKFPLTCSQLSKGDSNAHI